MAGLFGGGSQPSVKVVPDKVKTQAPVAAERLDEVQRFARPKQSGFADAFLSQYKPPPLNRLGKG